MPRVHDGNRQCGAVREKAAPRVEVGKGGADKVEVTRTCMGGGGEMDAECGG